MGGEGLWQLSFNEYFHSHLAFLIETRYFFFNLIVSGLEQIMLEEKESILHSPPFYPLPEYIDFQNAMSGHLMKNVHPVEVPELTNSFSFEIELGDGPVNCVAYTIPMIRAIRKPDLRKKPLLTYAFLPVKTSHM